MMGIALGGLGVLSLRLPHDFYHLVDLPTLLLAALLVFILALVAYFTNPSEASFRAFLTELAFRQHISRLSEAQEGDPDDEDDDTRPARPIDYKGPRKKQASSNLRNPSAHDSPIVFHFANKASVSLRTPGYRFRSFVVLTFAVVAPTELAFAGAPPPRGPAAPSTASGACFVGAFGRWWLAVEMRMLPRHVRLAAHDSTHAAVSDTPTPDPPKAQPTRRAPPPPRTKAALRERLSLHTSPPSPLPKSALLPLHGPPPAPPLLPPTASTPSQNPNSNPSSSPALADLLAQIDAARAANAVLHAQLAEAGPGPTHAALHAAVDAAREDKKREDAARAAIKARTKALDDARRQADSGKREAEKRLKAASRARDGTASRIERLERDIAMLRARMVADVEKVAHSAEESLVERTSLDKALAERRAEVAAVEDAVGRLTARQRDLEGEVERETARRDMLKTAHAAEPGTTTTSAWPPPLRPPSLDLTSHRLHTESHFSPFSDSQIATAPLSPVSAALLPSSLVQSMESPRESFFPRSDSTRMGFRSTPDSPVDAPVPAAAEERVRWTPPAPASTKGLVPGLNPTAKVFTLPSRRRVAQDADGLAAPFITPTNTGSPNASSMHASIPNAVFAANSSPNTTPFFPEPSSFLVDTPAAAPASPAPTFFSALHSAFAPSPAEREALQAGVGSGHSTPLLRPRERGTFFNPWSADE